MIEIFNNSVMDLVMNLKIKFYYFNGVMFGFVFTIFLINLVENLSKYVKWIISKEYDKTKREGV